ncbi:MAG: hypothetical protein IJN68_00090 [Clostridia bacterium]|nr:hypothetical protein [Clostridia bacterium]
MSFTINNFSDVEKSDASRSFSVWQSKNHEIEDEGAIRKRKTELYALVRKVIKNELDPLQQEIIRLHWYEEKSLNDIASMLGLDRSTVFRKEKKINEIIYDKLKYAIEYRFGEKISQADLPASKKERFACCPIEGKSISMRLRDLRFRLDICEKEVFRETGIKSSRLKFIESDGEQITVPELKKLTILYGTTSDYILFGRAPKYFKGGRQLYDT